MDHEKQAGKNFIWLSGAQVAVRVLALAFFVLMSYKIHEEGIGVYNFVGSFVPFWLLLVDLGAGNFLYREWSKGRSAPEEIARDANVLFTVRFFLAAAIFIPFLWVNYYTNRSILWSLVLFFASMFLAVIINLNDLYLQSNNLFKYTGIRQIIEKLSSVACAGILLFIYPRVEMVFVGILFSQVISFLYYRWRRLALPLKFLFDRRRALKIMRSGLPFMFIALLGSVYSRIDAIMLRYYKGFDQVGLYATAYKFLDISMIFSILFMSAVFPLLSSLYNNPDKKQEYRDLYNRSLRIIFSSGVMVGLLFIVFAPLLISRLFPGSFEPSVLALRILMLSPVLAFLSLFFSNLMIIQQRENEALKILIISAALNIGLNFFLIPRFSLYGAAWATVAAELANLYMLQRSVSWEKSTGTLVKMVLLVAGDAALLLALRYFGQTNNYILGSLVFIVNGWLLFILGLLRKTDIWLFLSPLKDKLAPWLPGFGAEEL